MSKYLTLAPVSPQGCVGCAFSPPCKGLDQLRFFGCFDACQNCGADTAKGCDYTCPRKPDFWRDWLEIGGPSPTQTRTIPGVKIEIPRYLPMFRHGFRRERALPVDFAAASTFEIVNSSCRALDATPDALRQRLMVRSDAAVVLVSVKQDASIESFWRHLSPDLLSELRALNVAAVTTPNYSLFDDAPRTHSIRNLWRIVRVGEALADAGISPIMHVNAVSRQDWEFWGDFLRANPGVRYVAKEFRTGLRDDTKAADALVGLRELQQVAGRDLVPVIVGGRRVVQKLNRDFERWVLIDSVPFFATVNRREIILDGSRARRVAAPTAPDETLDRLLRRNLATYRRLVGLCAGPETVEVPEELDEWSERSVGQPR